MAGCSSTWGAKRGLLPPLSCCVAEPSDDTPGGASHLHLQRCGTTKEGNEGLLVIYFVICTPARRQRRLGYGRDGGCHRGCCAVVGNGHRIRQLRSPPSFVMLRRCVPLALTVARHDKGGKRRIRGRGKIWHASAIVGDGRGIRQSRSPPSIVMLRG